MEVDEELDYEEQEEYVNEMLYGDSGCPPNQELNNEESRHLLNNPNNQTEDQTDYQYNLSQDFDEYDTDGKCEPCLVIINKYSNRFIKKAMKGQIIFEIQERDGSEDNDVHHLNESKAKSPEISWSDDHFDESHKLQTQVKSKGEITFNRDEDINLPVIAILMTQNSNLLAVIRYLNHLFLQTFGN